ncbi:MAG TPA: DUF5680 domain-containing protein [Ruminiclostridium sp.]|nr:DUF5680 domain-containing protein [Ruminiclostridium sp.]
MKFQERLQLLRKEKGISQEALAEKMNLSRQAIAKWEAGQSYPDLDNLVCLSDLLNISIDKLVRDSSDENCSFDAGEKKTYKNEPILDFLCMAKQSTYAGHGSEAEPTRPGSHDLQYADHNLQYIDTYLGGEKFSGQEALWLDGKVFWSMNYIGRVLADNYSSDFLKEVLSLVQKEYPYRGPLVYQKGDYKYHCIVSGEFEWFQGYEEIYCNNTKVYECRFHGGSVQ